MGGGEPYSEAKLEEIASAISIMDNDVNEILSKNISIFKYIKEFVKAKKYAYLNIKDMKPVVYKLIYGIKKD